MKLSWFSLPRSSAVWCVMHYCLLQIIKLISFVIGAGIQPCSPEMGCPCINLICASFQATWYIVKRVSLFAMKSTLFFCLLVLLGNKDKSIFVFAVCIERHLVASSTGSTFYWAPPGTGGLLHHISLIYCLLLWLCLLHLWFSSCL